jgi:hypothetical protein
MNDGRHIASLDTDRSPTGAIHKPSGKLLFRDHGREPPVMLEKACHEGVTT